MFTQDPPITFDPKQLAPPPLGAGPWPVTALALDVIGSCNLACRYCAEAATQPPRRPMSEATLLAAWRFLFPDGQTRPGYSIRLGSGEPLLALPLLRKLDQLITERQGSADAGQPDVFLTTNGTLASPAVRDWLVQSGWHVKLSLDGPQTIHDYWRVTHTGVGTYAQVAAAVTDLAQRMTDRFSVTAVLCRGADPAAVFASISALGVRRIELVPVAHEDPAIRPDAADIKAYEQFVEQYARRYLTADEESVVPTLVRFADRVRRVMGYDVKRIPCGAGRNFMGVGPEGDLYPCFRFVGLPAYRLGHLATGVDQAALTAFQQNAGRPIEERLACSQCWAAPLCGGPCFACAEMFGPGDGEPVALHCAYTLADARAAIWLVEQLRQHNPERLLAFLPDFAKAIMDEL